MASLTGKLQRREAAARQEVDKLRGEIVVGDLRRGGHDSEAGLAGRRGHERAGHLESILPSGSLVAARASRAAGHAPSSRPSAVRR